MGWLPAKSTFHGGTDAVKALVGRKVRNHSTRDYWTYKAPGGLGQKVRVLAGREGFVSHAWETYELVALADVGPLPQSLDRLARTGHFTVLAVDWDEFRQHFDIDG